MKRLFIKILFPIALLAIVVIFGVMAVQYIQERKQVVTKNDQQLSVEDRAKFEQEAREAEEAIKKDEKNFSAYLNRALAFEKLGEWGGAAEVYEDMNRRFPSNYISYSNFGNLLVRMKEYRKAEKMFLRAIENARTKPDLLAPLLEFYRYQMPEKQGRIPEVINESLKYNPKSKPWLLSVRATYEDELAHDPTKAMKTWEEVLAIDPKHEIAKRELDRLRMTSP